MNRLKIRRPADFHTHLRQGAALPINVAYAAEHNAYVLGMPNTSPPMITSADISEYHRKVLAVPNTSQTEFYYAAYMSKRTTPEIIRELDANSRVLGIKFYPAGQTTNSEHGVVSMLNHPEVMKALCDSSLALMMHGEEADHDVDVFDREREFYAIGGQADQIMETYPDLKRVVAEHITTVEAVDFVSRHGLNVAATITPQHLLVNRNHMLGNKMLSNAFCKPILKREEDRMALLKAATSGSSKFFMGTDSAPHVKSTKETSCGCAAGCFTIPDATLLYAQAFDEVDCLDKLEGFLSVFGPKFYELEPSGSCVEIQRKDHVVPDTYFYVDDDDPVVPFYAGETLEFSYV